MLRCCKNDSIPTSGHLPNNRSVAQNATSMPKLFLCSVQPVNFPCTEYVQCFCLLRMSPIPNVSKHFPTQEIHSYKCYFRKLEIVFTATYLCKSIMYSRSPAQFYNSFHVHLPILKVGVP